MVPRRVHAATTAVSTQVKDHHEWSILVETGGFAPMRWFLERGARTETDRDEPLTKKRRVLGKEDSDSQSVSATSNQIPLFEINVDIHFPDSWRTGVNNVEDIVDEIDFSDSVAVPVVLFRIESDDCFTRICVALLEKKSPVLFVECAALPCDVFDLLRNVGISYLSLGKLHHHREHDFPASVLSCALTRSTTSSPSAVRLNVHLDWRSGASALATVHRGKPYRDYENLLLAFPNRAHDQINHNKRWTPQDFYESVHATSKDEDTAGLPLDTVRCELYPFQKRAVMWMLKREGVVFKGGSLHAISNEERQAQNLTLYETSKDLDGHECLVNHVEGTVGRKLETDRSVTVSGGLLAEEMGLGKTVELLSLISLHTREQISKETVSEDSDGSVLPSKATLIITPATILQQWKSELHKHTPELRVHYYDGVTTNRKRAASEKAVLDDLTSKYDVVLTTYNVLRREVHFAEAPPDRTMRHGRKYERKRSPLVQVRWWRICLDEAQMVESGISGAARVACRLPRVHSWAVSGTPLRKNIEDLYGLLVFLRYWPFNENARLWSHLIDSNRNVFGQIFGQIALRHTKAQIREELHLPPQKRVVITIPFSVVEHQNYSNLFDVMCEEIGVNVDGSPKSETWNQENHHTMETMRTWLVRLRQTCLHPQVGGRNRRALGRGKGPLRTVAEVLQVMIEQVDTNLRGEERAVVTSSLLRAHIVGNNGEDNRRSEKALEIYKSTVETSGTILKVARERLALAKIDHAEGGGTVLDTEDEDSSSESSPLVGRLSNSVRTALQLHHSCMFFAATACFQIKTNESLTKPDSEEFGELEGREIELYEKAKVMRKELVKEHSQKAEVLMNKIKLMQENDDFAILPSIPDLEHMGGIESRRIAEKSQKLFDIIRKQGSIIVNWRTKIASFLLKPLVDEDEGIETTGDEYEDSTKQQDEIYFYFDAFKAVNADLHTAITGEAAPLIDHEAKILLRDAKTVLNPKIVDEQKPKYVTLPNLVVELLTQRNELRTRYDAVGSIRGLIQEARGLESSMQWIARQYLGRLQSIFTTYRKFLTDLENEIELFRNTSNKRVDFYRHLQELSDAVAPYKSELDPTLDFKALDSIIAKEDTQKASLAQLRTKFRFLTYLQHEASDEAGPQICAICQCSVEHGVLTVCGHQYCKECMKRWFQQSKNCPTCKKKLNNVDIHDITYKPQEIRVQEEVQRGESSSSRVTASFSTSPAQTSLYSDVDSNIMNEIKSVDLPSSYGTKIDTIGRHLHWIREHDPGAKSIVFSQYREFLDVLGAALIDFKIGYSRLGHAGATEKFRSDPSIDCLLLDAKTDSSGLTLVNATHVFLCEPLIQTAVELQAIARVHRIGQTRPTTVWMYLIKDTVEEQIYEISVARRLAHVQSRSEEMKKKEEEEEEEEEKESTAMTFETASPIPLLENAIDAANSEELQSAALTKLLATGKGGGELVGNDDLWQCLFGKSQGVQKMLNPDDEMVVGSHVRVQASRRRR